MLSKYSYRQSLNIMAIAAACLLRVVCVSDTERHQGAGDAGGGAETPD